MKTKKYFLRINFYYLSEFINTLLIHIIININTYFDKS